MCVVVVWQPVRICRVHDVRLHGGSPAECVGTWSRGLCGGLLDRFGSVVYALGNTGVGDEGMEVGGARARAHARSVEPLADEERKAPPVWGVGVVPGDTAVFCHAGRGVRGVALSVHGNPARRNWPSSAPPRGDAEFAPRPTPPSTRLCDVRERRALAWRLIKIWMVY